MRTVLQLLEEELIEVNHDLDDIEKRIRGQQYLLGLNNVRKAELELAIKQLNLGNNALDKE